jgi:hypothetical protein
MNPERGKSCWKADSGTSRKALNYKKLHSAFSIQQSAKRSASSQSCGIPKGLSADG